MAMWPAMWPYYCLRQPGIDRGWKYGYAQSTAIEENKEEDETMGTNAELYDQDLYAWIIQIFYEHFPDNGVLE